MTFTVDGTGCTNVALTWNGTVNVAQCTVDLPAGSFPVTAAYSGDEYTYPSQGNETITVS